MIKLHAVESVHYTFSHDKGFERRPYKVYRISVSSNECANNIRNAIENLARDFAEAINQMPRE